jgi:RNA polymerase sigma-70 factor, ECF subfamily
MTHSTLNPRPGVSLTPQSVVSALLDRHRAGDPRALDALMRELYPFVRRAVYRLAAGRAPESHDDLVQTALEQLCRAIDGFQDRSRVTTFVYGICFRVIAHARRYEQVRAWFRDDAERATAGDDVATPEALCARAGDVARARRTLGRLGVAERAAFVLHEIEQLSIEECAAALGCSPRTIKRRLQTARSRIRRAAEKDRPN